MKFESYHDYTMREEALTNIQYRQNKGPVDLYDAIEDSTTAEELRDNVNAVTWEKFVFSIDRETNKYVRLIYVSPLGNRHFLEASK